MHKEAPSILIDRSEIHLWSVSARQSAPAAFNAMKSLLSEDELARAERYRCAEDSARFVTARACLRRVLESYTGVRAQDIVFAYGTQGKPILSSSKPIPDIRFNLSHSSDMNVYAFALGQDVGIDIESKVQRVRYSDGYSRLFAPGELARMQTVSPDEREQLFLSYWTRKEACLKAIGRGFSLDPESVDVSTGPRDSILVRCPNDEEVVLSVTDFEIDGPYVGAIALEGGVSPRVFILHQCEGSHPESKGTCCSQWAAGTFFDFHSQFEGCERKMEISSGGADFLFGS